MATVNSVDNIAAMLAISSPTANDTVEVLGYYAPNDGGGGTFYWDSAATGTAYANNGGTIFDPSGGVSVGRWLRVYDSNINVRWFGAIGDGTTDDKAKIQKAIDFATEHIPAPTPLPGVNRNLNLYFPKGIYYISDPVSGDPGYSIGASLLVDLTTTTAGPRRIIIYGDGPDESAMYYDGTTINTTVLNISGSYAEVFVKDFSIRSVDRVPMYGTAIKMDYLFGVSMSNLTLFRFNTGLEVSNTNTATFDRLKIAWNGVGFRGLSAGGSLPNLFQFNSCIINSNWEKAVELFTFHNVFFNSCNFEGTGMNSGIANPLAEGGIIATYGATVGGASGLNVLNCYFEANAGEADIKIINVAAFGTHTITGNTFNRVSLYDENNNQAFTTNNILITGDGQSPPSILGGSKTKVVIQGNGFLAYNPLGTGYVPSSSRKAIELLDSSGLNDYWQFDLVEEGNQYTYLQPLPNPEIYDEDSSPAFDSKTPQISEFTRVKAFGTVAYINPSWTVVNGYNIASCTNLSLGLFRVELANDLGRDVIVNITPHNTNGVVIANITAQSTSFFVVSFNTLSGAFDDTFFNFTVF
ncbi:MAG TPA: glycosyl hydrolase family 28-related protein [Flavipsychrobacter sp.]|nr:glycosyl hydrolase family 28-related protein [Flavipsychrobacter sp.]